jgi:hypothetical protein
VPLQYKEDKLTFRRTNKHELKKLILAMNNKTDKVVEKLMKLIESPDEKVSLMAIAKFLDIYKESTVAVSTDEIQRLLLESKNPDRVRGLVEDDDTPTLDFTTVQDV